MAKATAGTGTAGSSRAKPAAKAKNEVTIRMYCQGLGDCFLIRFPRSGGGKPVHVMIDYGVFLGTDSEKAKMRQVIENIRKDTGGRIDLLVVTHEHWDHISGFAHSNDLLEAANGLKFDRVWMSWAENLDDPDSQTLKRELGKKERSLAAVLDEVQERMKTSSDPSHKRLKLDIEVTGEVLGFRGPGAAEGRMKLGDAMTWLREKVKARDYCSPGECRTIPNVDGVKVYVLGPPRDTKAIRKMNPTGDQGYKHKADQVSLWGALEWLGSDRKDEPIGPFEDRYRVSKDDAQDDPFFREYYGFSDDPLGDSGEGWRRIDDEWLGGVGRLGLQLDSVVNNTSLALAFELPDGRTLIFPGDAQIGNWVSWDEVKFKDSSGKKLEVTSKALLNQAVFYKVGHHGSHNATRRVGGLEEMTSGELVAMIPTDEEFAKRKKWMMPLPELYDAVQRMTHHRILRADDEKEPKKSAKPAGITKLEWDEFVDRVTFATDKLKDEDGVDTAKPLYIEYTIPL